jgi:hypothetical protein
MRSDYMINKEIHAIFDNAAKAMREFDKAIVKHVVKYVRELQAEAFRHGLKVVKPEPHHWNCDCMKCYNEKFKQPMKF